MNSRQSLRTELRQKRRGLTQYERRHFSQRICMTLARSSVYLRSQHIAMYLPNDGEVDLTPLIKIAWQDNKSLYLPVLGLRYTGRLWFVPYQFGDPLYFNRFGIPEPVHSNKDRYTPPRSLDLILMPLVGFDRHGNRLGMGGGFYDKTLAYRQITPGWRHPKCMGVAFSLQEVPALDTQTWDIPLDGIVTEQNWLTW